MRPWRRVTPTTQPQPRPHPPKVPVDSRYGRCRLHVATRTYAAGVGTHPIHLSGSVALTVRTTNAAAGIRSSLGDSVSLAATSTAASGSAIHIERDDDEVLLLL